MTQDKVIVQPDNEMTSNVLYHNITFSVNGKKQNNMYAYSLKIWCIIPKHHRGASFGVTRGRKDINFLQLYA
jgi:hypothetical protein